MAPRVLSRSSESRMWPLHRRILCRLNLNRETGCWEWLGAVLPPMGYGMVATFRYNGRRAPSRLHRLMYEHRNGPTPAGMLVCHKCDNPRCCNPRHLFIGTHLGNQRDMTAKRRHAFGERATGVKLTETAVRAIRSSEGMGRIVAKDFGISEAQVSLIRRGLSWRYLD